ncbi:MAG: formylmethanofuran dehydrogenase subunit C [Kiloniellales bacterium]
MALDLVLTTRLEVPLEAEAISPDRLAGLSDKQAARQPVLIGNRQAELGDFFKITGKGEGEVRVEGDLSRVKLIGAGMTSGRLHIAGNAGRHLGSGMRGGEIVVEGDADDWLGAEMSGGRILVKGKAAHGVGAGYRGSRIGMRGGEIVVHGSAGNEIGNALRNGLIAIGGDCGDYAGVNMLAGSIVVLGRLGIRCGAGMKRGSIVSLQEAEILPTFSYACTYRPGFLGLYLLHLRTRGLPIDDTAVQGRYKRWCGDSIELNRGEILLLAE